MVDRHTVATGPYDRGKMTPPLKDARWLERRITHGEALPRGAMGLAAGVAIDTDQHAVRALVAGR
jgi:hypothetical protein